MPENPYEPAVMPGSDVALTSPNPSDTRSEFRRNTQPLAAVSTTGTIVPRYVASLLDLILASVTAIVLAKQLPDEWLPVQLVVAAVAYLGYYFLFEAFLYATPGKLLSGLQVLSIDGSPCTKKQIAIRTLLRVFEVNPFLLGALPAALHLFLSRDRQRIGDRLANTIVVFRRLAKYHANSDA